MPTQALGFNLPILQQISITSGPIVSVSQFGAVGDGKKDDTAAIQSALNYIKANGGTLNFEAGHTYVVSQNVTITSAHDFKIDGNGATIKMAGGAPIDWAHSILRIETSNHFAVTELTLDGNRANRSPGVENPAHNVVISNSENFSFSDVKAINAVVDGFYVSAANPADRSTYAENGLFLNCRADNGYRQGMSIINGENIQVIGGAYTNTHGTKPAAGIDVESNNGSAVPGNHNILIRGVTFTGNDGYGVQLDEIGLPTNITVEGSYFANNDSGGLRLGTAWTAIKGNTFENFSQSFRGIIDLPAVTQTNSNNVITGNSFNNISTGQAVIYAHMYSGTNNQVYGNEYYNISGKFLETYTTGTTASDNVLTTSPTYPTTSTEPTTSPTQEPTTSPSPAPTTSGSVINGTSGDDQLVATASAETINGYAGADKISYLNSPAGVTVKLWSGTGVGGHADGDKLISIENVAGSNYKDRLEGTDGQNWLYGNGGDDILTGLGGTDILSGGLGADQLYGGLGEDWMYGNEGDDSLYGEAGNDRLQGGAGADRYVFDTAVAGNDTIADFDVTADKIVLAANLNGNGITTAAQALAHVHAGANGDAVLDLGGGNGVTFAGVKPSQLGVEDFVVGSTTTSSLTSSPQPTSGTTTSGSAINGTSGDDQLVATANAETINGYEGADTVSYLNSSSGVTVHLWSGIGVGGHAEGDKLIGIENVLGSNNNDGLEGTDGQNRLYGNAGDDTLAGLSGIDVLSGGLGADQLFGGLDEDWMYGNEGNDKLYGEAGNDRLQGGAGADTYVFGTAATGNDTIADFDVTADKIALAPNLNDNGINTAAQALAHVHAGANGHAVLELGGGNSVTFQGITPSQLSAEDFVVT